MPLVRKALKIYFSLRYTGMTTTACKLLVAKPFLKGFLASIRRSFDEGCTHLTYCISCTSSELQCFTQGKYAWPAIGVYYLLYGVVHFEGLQIELSSIMWCRA